MYDKRLLSFLSYSQCLISHYQYKDDSFLLSKISDRPMTYLLPPFQRNLDGFHCVLMLLQTFIIFSDAIRFIDLIEHTQTRIVNISAAGWEK